MQTEDWAHVKAQALPYEYTFRLGLSKKGSVARGNHVVCLAGQTVLSCAHLQYTRFMIRVNNRTMYDK